MKRDLTSEALDRQDAEKWRKLQKAIKAGKARIRVVCSQYTTNLDPDHGTMTSCGSCGFDYDVHSKIAQKPADEKPKREPRTFNLAQQRTWHYPQ